MGILDLMFGSPDSGEQGVEGRSYKLPKESHDFVYPVAVRASELEALARLHRVESEDPPLEERTEDLQAAVDDLLGEEAPDAAALTEGRKRTRETVGALLETWEERVDEEVGVVYVREGDDADLASYVAFCRDRAESEDDPLEPPEEMPAVVSLLSRIDSATDGQYRAVVHTDLLPAAE